MSGSMVSISLVNLVILELLVREKGDSKQLRESIFKVFICFRVRYLMRGLRKKCARRSLLTFLVGRAGVAAQIKI